MGSDVPLFVFNDGPSAATLQRLKELRDRGALHLLQMPYQVGKAEAVRRGLSVLLDGSIEGVVQVDGRQKQPPEDVALLIRHLEESHADIVIADRYTKQDLSQNHHRVVVSSALSRIISVVTGISVPDAACGTRAYRASLAARFLTLRGFGYGLEAEQLVIASLMSAKVSHVPVRSRPQEDHTPAEKIEDNICSLLAYADDLRMSDSMRQCLCYILSAVKARKSFSCDLRALGIQQRIRARFVVASKGQSYSLSADMEGEAVNHGRGS